MSLSKIVNPIGVRFCPTDEEIFDYYLRVKNLETNTSHVDEVISTVNICSSDPWHLPSMATTIVKTTDLVWYFFGRIENKYNRGDRQSRKTKSGFWKKTGNTVDIKRKSGNREKMGEKRVLMFYFKGGFKSKWVMHEYHATYLCPNQMIMMTYTLCKVEFKGDISCYVLENPCQIPESPDLDALDWVMCNILNPDFVGLADDDEQSRMFTWNNKTDTDLKKPLTGVFLDHSGDSDSISATTSSIQTSSTCDSFGRSNHCIDHITYLQESPTSTIKETSEKKKKMKTYDDALGTEIGENKMG